MAANRPTGPAIFRRGLGERRRRGTWRYHREPCLSSKSVARVLAKAAGARLRVVSVSTNTGSAPHCRIALAVAINDMLTVRTTPPGWTPTACKARWSAAVQLETAQACDAPV